MSKVEKLSRSKDSWQKSVDYYKGQIKGDVVMVGLGGLLMGVGFIAFAADAAVAGIAAETVGVGFNAIGASELKSDLGALIETAGTTAVRAYELSQAEAAEAEANQESSK